MKYYIIAGEASGDLHASNLIKHLLIKDNNAQFRFWGGDLMQKQSPNLVKHYKDLAFMGFAEVLLNLRTILKNIKFCKQDLTDYQPDALILVDYPGFNLRIAQYARKNLPNTKIYYYISPQVWAWKANRVHQIKKNVDKMLVILPFEQDFYAKYDYAVDFVGHPLLDAVNQNNKQAFNLPTNKKIIALLPGSRQQEIKKTLPIMLSVKPDFPDYEFVVAGAPSLNKTFYQGIGKHEFNIVENQTYALLQNAHAALVTSGTATLETALFGVPQVVCYKGNPISYAIAKRVVKHIKFISLVNLIMDREVIKELIQSKLNHDNLKLELNKILHGNYRDKMLTDYDLLVDLLGGKGASERAASLIFNDLK